MLKPRSLSELPGSEKAKLMERNIKTLADAEPQVRSILAEVKRRGDAALLEFTAKFDGLRLSKERLRVEPEAFRAAESAVPAATIQAIKNAARAIKRVHERQKPRGRLLAREGGLLVRQLFKPISDVGLYIPGGQAPYASTALMLSIPARVAGVNRIAAVSPPAAGRGDVAPIVLVALEEAGVTEVYRVGGVQAIAALAYGTETIKGVKKIVGPGNILVQAAKRLVAEAVGVDATAGPSEVLVFASDDVGVEAAEALALDLLAQAEHGPDSVAIFLTTSEELAFKVNEALSRIVGKTSRGNLIRRALETQGHILVASDIEEGLRFVEEFAPEHLHLVGHEAERLAGQVSRAGTISVGFYTPTSVVDYALGVNHVLPTMGQARFASPLTVYDFLRTVTVQRLSQAGLKRVMETALTLAEAEGLTSHADSIRARFR